MAQRPNVQRHHQRGRPRTGWRRGTGGIGGFTNHGEGSIGGGSQGGVGFTWNAVEHNGVGGWIAPGERKIGPPATFDGSRRVGAAVIPGGLQVKTQALETLPGQFRHQGAPVAKMAVWSRWADPCGTGKFGKGEAPETAFGNQAPSGLDERLAQIAVVVAVAGEGHVNTAYITRGARDRV